MEHQGQTGHTTAHVDEHGNQVAGHSTTTGVHGATGSEQMQPMRDNHKTDGVLRRSGSSSSSSSEDDGMGGRRKKGIKEKIKEKLPGGNKDNQQHATATGTTTGAHGTTADGTGEKKGVMDKIKEKLPGQH